MTRLHFVVPGIPKPKERPRVGRHGNVYTPKGTQDYERTLAAYALQAMARVGWRSLSEEPMAVWIHVYLPNARHRDIDNIAKAALDSVNGVVWRDDSQVHELHVYRRIDRSKPRLEVEVEAISDPVSAHACTRGADSDQAMTHQDASHIDVAPANDQNNSGKNNSDSQ